MNLKKLCPLALALLATLTAAIRLGAAIPPAENLLPADTFFVLTVPDCVALRKATAESPQVLLWNDPALRPFHDKFMGKWNQEFIGPLEKDLGLNLASFLDLPQGQLTMAVTRNGWDGIDTSKMPGLLLLLDAKEQSGLLKTNLDALQKKWADAGKAVRTETIHGVAFSVVPLSSNDVPPTLVGLVPARQPVQDLDAPSKPAKPIEMVMAQYQSLLIIGNSIKAVEPVVSRLTGGSVPVLADNSIFEQDKASQFRDAPVYYSWLNAHALCDVIAHIPAAEPNPDSPSLLPPISPTMVLNAAGLMGLKSVSLSYHQSHDGSLATIYFSVPEENRQGIFKMLATTQKDAGAPAFVPADAMKFWRWRLDSQKIWAELQKTLAAISPGVVGSLNGAIDTVNAMAQQKDASFDLRKNLLGNLGDDWMEYDTAPTGTSLQELSQSHGIFLFAAANPEQTLLALKTAAGIYSPQEGAPAPRDFLGHTIHTVVLRSQASATGAPAANSIYCSISSGYIALSTDVSVLEEYLRSVGKPPKPLSQTAGLADALQHIGGAGNGLFGYQDHQVEMRTAFASLKQVAGNEAMKQATMPFMPKSFGDWLDFSLLPDYDQVAKYFYFSVFTGTTTPQGITFQGYYPRPPQLN